MLRLALAFIVAALVVPSALAQPGTLPRRSAIEQADSAFAERRFDEAVRLLDRLIEAEPENSEARYLLARTLVATDNPNRDQSRAASEIDRAVRLDPENVLYLVARLEVLREDSNFLIDLLRARQRQNLANRILELDPDNAFAHEELGLAAIRDYYQYRNAIALPFAAFTGSTAEYIPNDLDNVKPEVVGPQDIPTLSEPVRANEFSLDPLVQRTSSVLASDRFDVEAIEERGTGVISLSGRADDAYESAITNLQAALDADPRRRSIYDHVVRLASISGNWRDAAADLGEMFVQFPEDPEMWLYTGLMNQRLGQYEAADIAFREGLKRMSDDDRAAFTDLTLILPPAEWPDFRADPEAFSQRYWSSRDPRYLNGVNERRTEHYARLTEADLNFASDDLRIPGWKSQRGLIWTRYGPPSSDVMIDGSFALVLESFQGRDPQNVPPEMLQRSSRFNVWNYGDEMRFVFEDVSRKNEFRLYSPPADLFSLRSAGAVSDMDFVERAEETVRRMPEQYEFVSPGRRVDLPYRITAFKGEEGNTDIYVNYGIPLGAAEGNMSEDVDVTLKTGAFLVGPERNLLVERRRTVYGLRGAQIVPFEEARLWTSTELLAASPGPDYEVALEFETSSAGTSASQRRPLDVRNFADGELELSDILLAYFIEEDDAAVPGRVSRNGLSIQAAPWGVFAVDDPIYLYVEIYGLGLADGRSNYEVEARLQPKDMSRGLARIARRIFGGGGRGVSSAFEGDGSRSDDWRDLILDAADQEPGYYTLTVTVRDRVSGKSTRQETDLLLE